MSEDKIDTETIEDVSDSIASEFFRLHWFATGVSVAFSLALFGGCAYLYVIGNTDEEVLKFISYLFAIAFLPLGIPAYLLSVVSWGVRERFIEQLGKAIGFEKATDLMVIDTRAAMFATGEDHMKTEVLVGSYRGYLVNLYTHTYLVQSGKHKTTVRETVYELTYDHPLPHILLNFRYKLIWSDVEDVELEGTFNDVFSLKAERGKQVEVREILQPDVMELLMKYFQDARIEIIAEGSTSKVYLTYGSLLDNRTDFLNLIRGVDGLIDMILPGLQSVGRDSTAAVPVAA